jgi:hypothetical protein
MPPPPLPSKDAFRDSTKNSNPFAMRGGIAAIDEALSLWEKAHSLENALLVFRECRHWLIAKSTKQSENTALRREKVRELAGKAAMWMVHFDSKLGSALLEFERRKDAGPHIQAKPMPGVYAFERNAYLKSGKKFAPPSATRLDGYAQSLGSARQLPPNFPDFFSQLNEEQFKTLDKLCKEQHSVKYLKKIDRLRYMVRAGVDGKLRNYDFEEAATSGSGGWAYAMDRYGSLFVINQNTPGEQINHSTLNAGKEVICAGMIKIQAGFLKMISNNSGHYKPTQKELYNAVQMLVAERIDLSKTTVELWDYLQEVGRVHIWTFQAKDFRVSGRANGTEIGTAPVHAIPLRGE